ncbi:MAG: VapE domain-containing protein, partial [Myxococcales bacterium]
MIRLHSIRPGGGCTCKDAEACKRAGKHPSTKNGLIDGTTDPDQIFRWWAERPTANVGIVTGAESGLVVLDVDPKSGGDVTLAELEIQHGRLPDTVEAVTGSRGRHILFRHPGVPVKSSVADLGPGLDTRADGGYIVAAPSMHASGNTYEWEASGEPGLVELAELPTWVLAALAPKQAAPAPAGTVSPESALRRARAWLSVRDPAVEGQGGDRHTFLTAANLVNDFGLAADEAWSLLLDWNARCVPPWSERELRAKLDSALRNGKHAKGSKQDRPLRSVPPPHDDHDAPPPVPDEPPPWLDQHLQSPADGRGATATTDGNAAKVVDIKKSRKSASEPRPSNSKRPLKSRSYLSLVTILETDQLRGMVLGKKKLEFDEMGGVVTIDRKPIRDVDYSILRAEIERRFEKNSEGDGMQFALDDIVRAVHQVAHAAPFHPVREYLRGLKWDGVPRWTGELLDSLGAERTPLNASMIGKWAISAVARALQPGCKVDTVLILKGDQGIHKSTWFRAMTTPWFAESTMDLENKESFMVLQRNWIVEWSELEAMSKARDQTAVKAFITKTEDVYVPKYGREAVRQPRSSVIVGTTNEQTFLADPTGNRRYWPISVTRLDLD